MPTPTTIIHTYGGLAATHELYAAGIGRGAIRTALAETRIIRVRQGWYALPQLHSHLLESARVGGRATAVTGLRLHGIWAPESDCLHVSVPHYTARHRTRTDSRLRMSSPGDHRIERYWSMNNDPGTRLLLDPLPCLADLIRGYPSEYVIAAAESALHQGILTQRQWHSLLQSLPGVWSRDLRRLEARAESGLESITRVLLERDGILTTPQQRIPGVGRVDLALGRLVIELDGLAYHGDRARFDADRRRDAELVRRGYRVLRFSYTQVVSDWLDVLSCVRACLARSEHLP